jgi:excisionase family DNA binding protein
MYAPGKWAIRGGMNNTSDPSGKGQTGDPTVLACVVFQTRDPEQLVQLLREALTRIAAQVPTVPPASPMTSLKRNADDHWLRHSEAAEYLGISKSTLYRYACQQKIECRKLAGRLEYHCSTLDQFKDLHIRPTQCGISRRSIIPTALGSGK